jgi:hypothetical protein
MDTGVPDKVPIADVEVSPAIAVAAARLGKAVALALNEYLGETMHQGNAEDLLNKPESLKDFGLYLMHATDISEWGKNGT